MLLSRAKIEDVENFNELFSAWRVPLVYSSANVSGREN
jgi:tRNA A37 threonylcarbamoyladenosine synthetase subunit TsaC/SUA5/YrdC